MAMMADVFFIQMRCYESFRRGAAVTTEAAAGSIKAEQRRPRERGPGARQREETQQNTDKKKAKKRKKEKR